MTNWLSVVVTCPFASTWLTQNETLSPSFMAVGAPPKASFRTENVLALPPAVMLKPTSLPVGNTFETGTC